MGAAASIRPATLDELVEAIAAARGSATRLAIRGGGSKAGIGASTPDATELDLRGFSGVIDYDPAELTLTVGAGTPLAEVEALVAGRGQMLGFEPFDHGPLFGGTASATIGGVVAAGIGGSQRVSHGGARDHLLGFVAVSGRAERFVAGAKVVKNVTGYDLPKLAAGSWGRLFAMTELTLKTLPAPRESLTKLIEGLDFRAAQRAMSAALGSQADVAAAAYLPAAGKRRSVTALRIQGFGPSVAARSVMLDRLLEPIGRLQSAPRDEAAAIWEAVRTLEPLRGGAPLWRINLPPSEAPGVVASLPGDWVADWGGGLLWMASDAEPERIRAAAGEAGGHAMLVRAPADLRNAVAIFHPPAPGIAALEARIRLAFDPDSVFETGRFRGAIL